MILEKPLRTERLILRTLDPAVDATESYLSWFSDPEITQFLEVRLSPPTSVEDLASFVLNCNSSTQDLLVGIVLASDNRHIGNIKLGPINEYHRRADVGLLIGHKSQWGRGLASEAIGAVSEFAFSTLGLHKLIAGVYSRNIGSYNAFRKNGYVEEARLTEYWDGGNGRQDEVILGKVTPHASVRSFRGVRRVVLIGGGPLLITAAEAAKLAGFATSIVLAPRHAEESMDDSGVPARAALQRRGYCVDVVGDINALETPPGAGTDALALCLGPAWIFQERVRRAYGAGMLNFNGIPIPRYLGGAHFTWQILNGSVEGGCVLQEIDENIDRGAILRHDRYTLPPSVRTPADYYAFNNAKAETFLRDVLADIAAANDFPRIPFSALDKERLYFPRLITRENAWIDWSWDAQHIATFCQAFDDPYPGAGTLIGGQEVRLKKVELVEGSDTFHPFCAGLIVRTVEGATYVAAPGGLLRIGWMSQIAGEQVSIKEGHRFATPPQKLYESITKRAKITPNAAGT